jgi:Ca2+-transporting ATPase
MSLIPSVLGWDLILQPVHIVFLELIIDPACSIVFEADPGEKDAMRRPPRNLKEPLFNRQTLGISLLQGLTVLTAVVVVFAVGLWMRDWQSDEETFAQARALSFTALILANLGLILTNLSWSRSITATLRSHNAALWWVLGLAPVFLALVLYVPALRQLFKFGTIPLHLHDILICLLAAAVSILWFEIMKSGEARFAKTA